MFKATLLKTVFSIALGPLLALGLFTATALAAAGDELQTRELRAMNLVQSFAGQLKPRLKAALAQGGPVHAIDVCATAAPDEVIGLGDLLYRKAVTEQRPQFQTPMAYQLQYSANIQIAGADIRLEVGATITRDLGRPGCGNRQVGTELPGQGQSCVIDIRDNNRQGNGRIWPPMSTHSVPGLKVL